MKRRKFIKYIGLGACGLMFYKFVSPAELKAESKASLKFKPEPDKWSNDEITLAWIGHSTVLINFFGRWILTDPVLFERIGVYFLGTNMGPNRITPPALKFDEMPKPDLILLSHAHMDHMDYLTLKNFAAKYPNQIDVVTAHLTKDVIDDLEWKSLTSVDWNNEINIAGIRIKALETKHFGARLPWEKDRSRGFMKDGRSYNAYILENKGKKILFGGDTAFTDLFEKQKNENIDIAIMPVGAYNPWSRVHCNPEEAVKMAVMANAKYFVPIHCKTFRQSSEPFNEPIDRLKQAAPASKINLCIDSIGQTFTMPK
jgi:L-ascorbate metabolism protein UlaG (beta-lactamase superfamily)